VPAYGSKEAAGSYRCYHVVLSQIRVLESISSARIGGAELYALSLCRVLPDLGASVELFCPSGRTFIGYASSNGYQCTNWKTRGKLDPVTVCRLARLMRTRADVIHTHLSTASLLGAVAAKIAGRPSVAHVHGLNTATCYKLSTLVVAVSETVKRHLCAQGLDEKKVLVVYNGVDAVRFHPRGIAEAKADLNLDVCSPYIGVFGRLSSEKGQRVAIAAFAALVNNHTNAHLLVVGQGVDEQILKRYADRLGVSNSVHFIGFTSDIPLYMAACDAILVPSLKEGFGLVAAEAMAVERPVVASGVGGLSEVVVDESTGFIVPPNDCQMITKCLERLITDKELAVGMGKRGRKRVLEHFEIGGQVRALSSVLHEAIDTYTAQHELS
jgi:glycosyltransferase involved in cell wall biosynthesis